MLIGPAKPYPSLVDQVPPEQVGARIRDARDAVAKAGTGRLRRAVALRHLAVVLFVRFYYEDRRADLAEAIDVLHEAISLLPRQHARREGFEQALATLLCARGHSDDITEAVTIIRRLLSTAQLMSTQHGALLWQLGNALLAGYLTNADTGATDAAIDLLEQAVAGLPQVGVGFARVRADAARLALALGLVARYQQRFTVDPDDLVRVAELIANVDRVALENTVPGTKEAIDQLELGLRPLAIYAEADSSDWQTWTPDLGRDEANEPRGGRLGNLQWSLESTKAQMGSSLSYGFGGDLQALDDGIAEAEVELDRTATGDRLRGVMLAGLAQRHLIKYRTLRLAGMPDAGHHLATASRLVDEAMAEPDPHAVSTTLMAKGECLVERYGAGLGSSADLDEAIRLLERAVMHETPDSRFGLVLAGSIAEALMVRAFRDSNLDDLDEAERTLIEFRERTPPGSSIQPVVAARIAVVLQHRASVTEDTEDVLRASSASRAASAEIGEVSPTWAYDVATSWANWAWLYGPMSERADAYRQAVTCLHRLVRKQFTRGSAEVALRRTSQRVVSRAGYALAATERHEDAVAAVETGRAVLLSMALERSGPVLSDAVDIDLRRRFHAAVARVAAAEAAVNSELAG